MFLFPPNLWQDTGLGSQALYNNFHHLDLLTLPCIPRSQKATSRGSRIKQFSRHIKSSQQTEPNSVLVGTRDTRTFCSRGILRPERLTPLAARSLGLLTPRGSPPLVPSVHTYLTLCRVCSRFRFLSSSNFLFSILASKLASSEATLLSRSFVF